MKLKSFFVILFLVFGTFLYTNTTSAQTCTITTTLRQGSRGAEVICLQNNLNLTPDGIFGPKTRASVIILQQANNLVMDGIFGPKSRFALFSNSLSLNNLPSGCTSTSLFSILTGQSCINTIPAGCTSSAGFSITTGAPCSSSQVTTPVPKPKVRSGMINVEKFTLTYTAGDNGTITGTTPQTVNEGRDGTSITATPDSGYVFDTWSDGVLTAERTDTNILADKTVNATFLATIATAPIAGITAPVTGATPTATITDTSEYTATISWSPTDATFLTNTVYTASITITPKTGYTLSGIPANFFTVAGATATNAIDVGVVSAVFPATFTPLAIGDSYQGGKIGYIFQSGDPGYVAGETHGLIAAVGDQGSQIIWGCKGTSISTSRLIGTGYQNTINIMAGCATAGIAARVARDYGGGGYDDWYLPSQDELIKIVSNRDIIGGFTTFKIYWDSSEVDINNGGGILTFTPSGMTSSVDKDLITSDTQIRAVRSF